MSNQKRFGMHFQFDRCETSHDCDALEDNWGNGMVTYRPGKKHLSVRAAEGQDGLLVVLVLNGKFSKRRLKSTIDRIYSAAGVKQ